jgi:kumamolisin
MPASKFVKLPGGKRPKQADATRISDVNPQAPIEVTLSLKGPKLLDADALSASPISRSEFAAKYGANVEDADKVAKVLQGYGLTVKNVSLPTCSMRVEGPADAIEKAFQSSLGIYHSAKQGDFRGREGDIKIPEELKGLVTGVFGLDERQVARRKAVVAAPTAAAAKAKLSPLSPGDFEKRYNFPPGDGTGQQIGIAEFGSGYFAEDLQAFCAKYNLPVANVTTVSVGLPALTLQDIQQLPPQQRDDELQTSIEVNMDVQIVAGLCPKADIYVYFAPFTQKGWIDLLNKVMSGDPANPTSLSISWGLAEDAPDWSQAALQEINNRLNAAAMLGITVCVSSGDDGSGDQLNDGRAHIDFPSSSPFVLSVGGTMLSGTPQNLSEQVWWESPGRRTNKGGGSTGGGVSVVFQRPQWQNVKIASLNKGSIDGRVIPDVAALAGPPLYDLIFVGRDFPNGGTSASTPLWASLIARLDENLPAAKRHRFLTILLYQNGPKGKPSGSVGCTDIIFGQNASHPQPAVGYKAQAGFDAVTGWGVPDGTALLGQL